jgi:hypothetical protein
MDSCPGALAQWKSLICNPRNERTGRELVQMTNDERTRVFADIGGAADINPEEPDFINECLMELNRNILRIEDRNAYLQAQRTCPHYTNNPGFRILFLRADNFDTKKCAQRIVNHFEVKLQLFGPEKLAKDITLSDLSSDDMESLESGAIQFLPVADQFGRAILFSRQIYWKYKSRDNLVSKIECSTSIDFGSLPAFVCAISHNYCYLYPDAQLGAFFVVCLHEHSGKRDHSEEGRSRAWILGGRPYSPRRL